MVHIKKSTLAIILVVVLVIGSFGTVFFLRCGIGESTLLTTSRYKRLLDYEKTYYKMDKIKTDLKQGYYIDIDEDALFESAYKGLVEGLDDPYSEYIKAEDWDAYYKEMTGTSTYAGVGITFLNVPIEGKGFYAVAVNTKGPAYAAGVRKGDIICAVNGVDALTMDGDTLRDTIRGEVGSIVTVELIGKNGKYTVNIQRAEIPTESVVYEQLDDVAVIEISSFIEDTAKDFADALNRAESSGVKGIVLDIRDNGGGIVQSAQAIADLLMNKATLVTEIDHNGNKNSLYTNDGRTSLPYVVLVNGNSASASEILTSGIQDNNEGKIVGTQTFGKGIVQGFDELGDGSVIKLTLFRYVSPKGNEIHKIGITPDVIVDLSDDCYDENGILENDVQLKKAIEVLRESF